MHRHEKLRVANLSDNMQQTCITGRSLISLPSCRPRTRQYPLNTPVIVDEASALLKAARIYRDNKLRGQTGETPSQLVLLHLLMSREPAKWFRVLYQTSGVRVAIGAFHFRDAAARRKWK